MTHCRSQGPESPGCKVFTGNVLVETNVQDQYTLKVGVSWAV